MKTLFKNAALATSIGLLLPLFAVAELPHQTTARKEAIQLSRTIENTSRKIHHETENLANAQRNPQMSRLSHQIQLERIKSLINGQLKPAFDRLAEIQPHLPEWKQTAVDQMRTSAASLASSTNEAILNRNANSIPAVLDPNYRDMIANMTTHADNLVQIADATSDYSSAQLKGNQAGLSIASHD